MSEGFKANMKNRAVAVDYIANLIKQTATAIFEYITSREEVLRYAPFVVDNDNGNINYSLNCQLSERYHGSFDSAHKYFHVVYVGSIKKNVELAFACGSRNNFLIVKKERGNFKFKFKAGCHRSSKVYDFDDSITDIKKGLQYLFKMNSSLEGSFIDVIPELNTYFDLVKRFFERFDKDCGFDKVGLENLKNLKQAQAKFYRDRLESIISEDVESHFNFDDIKEIKSVMPYDRWMGECRLLSSSSLKNFDDSNVRDMADILALNIHSLTKNEENKEYLEKYKLEVMQEAGLDEAAVLKISGAVDAWLYDYASPVIEKKKISTKRIEELSVEELPHTPITVKEKREALKL